MTTSAICRVGAIFFFRAVALGAAVLAAQDAPDIHQDQAPSMGPTLQASNKNKNRFEADRVVTDFDLASQPRKDEKSQSDQVLELDKVPGPKLPGGTGVSVPEQRIPRAERPSTGSIVGVLQSAEGRALGGARIVLRNSSRPAPKAFQTVARSDGWFAILDVPAGPYTLEISFDGFDTLTQANTMVKSGDTLALELSLKPKSEWTPTFESQKTASSSVKASRAAGLPRRGMDEPATQTAEVRPPRRLIDRTEAEEADQRSREPVAEDGQVFASAPNRWESRPPAFRRYAGNGEYQYVQSHWYDPFNVNALKGDRPILGNRIFANLSVVSETFSDRRQLPLPAISSLQPSSFGLAQQAMAQNFSFSAEIFGGDAAFRPIDWRIRINPVVNLNYASAGAPGLLNFTNPQTTRFDKRVGLQEAFVEAKLKDLSNDYDFLSARAGIQAFNSDFRGFIFADRELGVRLSGNAGSNRYQYNVAGFATLGKDANSGLNTLVYRNQQVYVANIYRQDFPWRGYTLQASFHYNKDDPSAGVNSNNFQVRPVPIGPPVLHAVRAYYYGLAGDGHIGRVNVSHAFYQTLGHDTYNAIAGRPVQINAQMGALELSMDRDWIRYRASFFYASGARDARGGTARGFDAILDNPNFAGGIFSFWNREQIDISSRGVALVNSGSLLPNLRSGRASGQANFINPGLFLYNAGADADLTPKLRAFANLNLIRFANTEPLQILLNRPNIHAGVGADSGFGLRYRLTLNDNIVIAAGFNAFLPFEGFAQIYSGRPLFATFTNIQFRY